MDHIKDLSAFQGVILSADNVHSFAKLKSKGGNEEKVKYVVEKLLNFLKEKDYITEDGIVEEYRDEYKKLVLYLVLNADLPALELMTELEGVEAIIWTLPTVPAYLLSELGWGLHMGPLLCEVIAFCAPALALQLGEALVGQLKYMEPTRHLERAERLAAALYRLLLRLHFLQVPVDASATALSLLSAALGHLSSPRRADTVLALPRDDQYRYVGRSLELSLRLVEDCLGRFVSVETFEAEGFCAAYLATYPPDVITTRTLDFKICDSPDGILLGCLREGNAFLLDACAKQVMSVSVDVFCAWSEYEENGRSLQQDIGEQSYRVGELLRTIPDVSDHALCDMLKQISRKPPSVEELITDASADTIAERIDARDADSAAWLAALLRRDDLCRRADLLQLLQAKLSQLDFLQSEDLFEAVASHAQGDNPNAELLKALAVGAFRGCLDIEKNRILHEQFSEHLHDDFETAEFEETLTDAFNRLSAALDSVVDSAPGLILAAFLQNPRKTLARALKAAADSAILADAIIRLLNRLPLTRCYRGEEQPELERTVAAALHEPGALEPGARTQRLTFFLTSLVSIRLLDGDQLFRRVVMPRLQGALCSRDAAALAGLARLLEDAAVTTAIRAPLLAMIVQALDAARVSPLCFAPAAPAAVDALLQLAECLLENPLSEKELSWLRPRLLRASPMTRAHFAALLPAPKLREIVQRNPLAVLLLSPCEWQRLLHSACPRTLNAVFAALRRAGRAERRRRTPRTRAALLHAHHALAAAVKNNYFSDPPTEEEVLAVATQLSALAADAEVANVADDENEADDANDANDAAELAAAWLPLLAHAATACPELRTRLSTLLAHAPLLAKAFEAPGDRYERQRKPHANYDEENYVVR